MPEHDCKHETDLALIAERITQILTMQKEIRDVVTGNGKEGLRDAVGRIKTKLNIQWALFLFMFGLVGWIIKLH